MTLQEFVKHVLADLSPIVGEGTITFDIYVLAAGSELEMDNKDGQHLTFSVEVTPKLAAAPVGRSEK